jgi:hypothetical protein
MNNGLLTQQPHPPGMPYGLQELSTPKMGSYGLTGFDPYAGLVRLNVSLKGTMGSRVFIDTSSKPKQLSPNGRVHVTTTQSAAEGSSTFFGGSIDWIETADDDELSYGLQDFTIECWIYQVSSSSASIICAKNDGAFPGAYEYAFYINPGQILGFGFYGTSFQGAQSSTAYALNTWHHVAVVRSGSNFAIYRNGSSVANFVSSQSLRNTNTRFTIGRDYEAGQGGRFFNGFISDLRVTARARYTSNFPPPVGPFPAQ